MTDQHEKFEARAHGVRAGRGKLRREGWRNAEVLRTAALVIGMYVLVRLFWLANPLFFTAFLGILFGLAVASGVDHLARLRIPRGAGAGLIVIAFFGLLFGFGAWMAPTLRSQGAELRRKLPEALEQVQSWARAHQNGVVGMLVDGVLNGDPASVDRAKADSAAHPGIAAAAPATPAPAAPAVDAPAGRAPADSMTIASTIRNRIGSGTSGMRRFLFPFLTSTLEVVGGILIIVFLSIYIAADPELYHRGIMAMFPRARRKRAGEVLSAMAAVLRRWLITQLIAMAAIGTVTTIVLLILRVKAAFALGLLSGLFEFIPTVGPILSAVPAVAMAFLDAPEKALLVAGAYVLIQFMENHLLIPLLMKGGVNIPPVLTILSQALMALLFGFIGLMVAVPLLAATMVAVKMLYVENVVGERSIGPDEDPAQGVR